MGIEELPLVSMGQARYIIRKLKKDVSSLRAYNNELWFNGYEG